MNTIKYKVYDDREEGTLFEGNEDECMFYMNENYPEDNEDFEHIWMIGEEDNPLISNQGIQRLEGYKFYEIHDPYFALIKAIDEEDAVNQYIKVVAGNVSDNDELMEEIKEVDLTDTLIKYVHSFYQPAIEIYETIEEYLEFLLKEESNVLLVDGSLL